MDPVDVPKVELHCHLLGVISPALLARIEAGGDPTLVSSARLRAAPPIIDARTFQNWVDTLKPYQADSVEAMQPVLTAHISKLVEQQVKYAEIMISPTMFPVPIRELLDAVRRWRDWSLELEHGQIQVEFLMSVPRTLADAALARDMHNFVALAKAGLIAGVAIVGVETGASIQRFAAALDRWRDAGLGIEIHAGEHGGPAAVWDALEFGKPDRLGHALAAFEDDELVERIRNDNVHLEFCPTSNRRTAAITRSQLHPATRARQLGVGFSLNTDNPGAFGCSLNDEFWLAADEWGFERDDFDAIYRSSLAARFEPLLRYAASEDSG